jgi:hypothetical protein
MNRALRPIAACALVLVALASGALVASAETLTFEPAGSIAFRGRLIWTEALGLRTTCNLTMSGTLERSVTMTPGTSMGAISSSTTEACSPWRVVTLTPQLWGYTRLLGQPQTITGILSNPRTSGILIQSGENGCLYFIEYGILIGVNAQHLTTEVTILEAQSRLSRTLAGTCLLGTLSLSLTFGPTQRVAVI